MTAQTTLVGNTTADVELRYTQSGKAVANVTIAVADRKFDRATNEWTDGDTWFARCSIWGDAAEHAAGSITKGTRVIAIGRIGQRDWEDKEGNKRTSVEVTLDEIGPSLRYATAQVTRASSGGERGQNAGTVAEEPWDATAPAAEATGDAWNTPGNYTDETPF